MRLLTTFEAVSRHGSMREAALKLNVTQPAVSQALTALEDYIGAPLIDRSVRPARLTETGDILARAVRGGLGQITAAVDHIRALHDTANLQVTVSCTLGMASYWLMPRLPAFYAEFPDITVNVQAPATDLPVLAPGVDIALRYGVGGWREGQTQQLFPEQVCPVGAPDLVARLLSDRIGLDTAPLIHVRSQNNQHWAGWEDYLRLRGITRHNMVGQSFNNYVQAAQAVLDGRGMMLGWRSITGNGVRDGALAPWPDGGVDLGTAYYVTAADDLSASGRSFLKWITGLDDSL
ncbi:LysR substrate-binding domain-containing protein [Paracoccus sp. Ld10]|uniref:LysR substrate-binding domain-containing protein n=1 Tax=Paracoccus sp. Ld10 TaxID=649158 RepID=UPI003864729D